MGYARQGRIVTVDCANGSYRIAMLAPDVVRVRFLPTDGPASSRPTGVPFSYSVARSDDEWPACEFRVIEALSCVEIRTSRLICRIDKATGEIAFLDLEGNVISEDETGAGWHPSGGVICRKQIQPDEHFYGLGCIVGAVRDMPFSSTTPSAVSLTWAPASLTSSPLAPRMASCGITSSTARH